MQSLPIDWVLLWRAFAKTGFAFALALPSGWWGEREGHAVGIRTFPIVAMASCGFMMVFAGAPQGETWSANSRVLQGLIAGIGFVGGGAIVRDGISVRGTATAASIWNTGAIGAAVAIGRNEVAIVLAVLNLFTLGALVPLKKRLDQPAN